MKSSLCVLLVLLTASTNSLLAEVDGFDSPPYTVGDIVGQPGPASVWGSGSWANLGTGPASTLAGSVVETGKLEITQTDFSGAASALAHSYNGISLSGPYEIEFDLRVVNIDSLLAGGFNGISTNAGDYLNVFDKAAQAGDFGGDGTWLVRGGQFNSTGKSISNNGGPADTNKIDYDADAPLNWYVFDYTPLVQNAFTDADVVDTGIALTAGTDYHFTITILGGGQWNLKLTDGTDTFDSALSGGPYGFRSFAALPTGNLHYGYSDLGTNTDTADGFTIQVDNVAVPEPSVLLLGSIGLLMAFVFRRRRTVRPIS